MEVNGFLAYYLKVKSQLSGNPALWKEFQEFQNTMNSGRHPCEILTRLSILFRDHPDFTTEFEDLFLPETYKHHLNNTHKLTGDTCPIYFATLSASSQSLEHMSQPPVPDESVSHVSVYGTYKELQFFDKVRKALGHEKVYENFLHCLELYNDDLITRLELVRATDSFLAKFPELQKQLKDMLQISESGENVEPVPHKIASRKKLDEEIALDIDYCAGKKHNASYRPLPKSYRQPACSGRTPLCKEVLNDTWVSFPAWFDDPKDSKGNRNTNCGGSCKTKYENAMYKIEDERFELDMAIQTNAYVIDVLNDVQRDISRLSEEQKAEFSLDDTLGGSSSALNYRFIHRIYGDRTKELMEGLKRNPVVAVPIVLNRLRVREKEWKDVQEKYNVLWREQTNRVYLKSLDHQGINFKQNDAKNMRPKTLLNEIETHYEERKQKIVEGSVGGTRGPHITCCYKELRVFKDALNFILHDIKRQPGIYKGDRRHIADLLCFFIAGFFNMQTDIISSSKADKKNDQNCVVDVDSDAEANNANSSVVHGAEGGASDEEEVEEEDDDDDNNFLEKKSFLESVGKNLYEKIGISADQVKILKVQESVLPYSLFFVNNSWYIFFRLFSVLIERLGSLYVASLKIEAETRRENMPSTSSAEYATPYSILLNKVYSFISGKIDSSKFEDEMRELFTIHAYVSYTLDKVIHAVVKQLHLISSDDVSKQCMTNYATHAISLHDVTNPWLLDESESLYEKKAVKTVGEENCYKVTWFKEKSVLAIELLDPAKEFTEQPVDFDMSDYLDNYLKDDVLEQDIPIPPENRLPVIQRRNLRKQRRLWALKLKKDMQSDQEQFLNTSITYVPYRRSSLRRKNTPEIFPSVSKRRKRSASQYVSSVKYSHWEEEEKNTKLICSKRGQNANTSAESNENLIECSEMVDMASCSNGGTLVVRDVSTPIGNLEQVSVTGEKSLLSTQGDVAVLGYDVNETEEGGAVETVAYEEDEDSINVSAVDLYFHLTQTMPIFEHFPGAFVASSDSPFYQKSCDSEFVMENKNNELDSPEMGSSSSKSVDENRYSEYCTKLVQDVQLPVSADRTFKEPAFIQSEKETIHFEYDQSVQREIPRGVFFSSEPCSSSSTFTPSSQPKECSHSAFPDQELHTFHDRPLDEKDGSKLESQVSETISSAIGGGINLLPSEQLITSEKHDAPTCTKSSISSSETSERKDDGTDVEGNIHPGCSYLSPENESDSDVSLISDGSHEPTVKESLEMAMQDMVIFDNSVCVFDGKTSKMQFAGNSHDFCYRKGSFLKARKIHREVSARFNEKFGAWHRIWLERYVTTNMLKSCHDWLLRSESDKYRVYCVTVNNQNKPPYSPYTKYCVRFYKRR